jgi:glycosyltransferase involved in cell wall biosynthesis
VDQTVSTEIAGLAPRSRQGKRLSIVVPMHDEAPVLGQFFERIEAATKDLGVALEIICVDDGSRDGTADLADALAAAHPELVRAVHHEINQGYGAALRTGFRTARYPLVAFTDGDRQFRLEDLARTLERLDQPVTAGSSDRPDAVVGFRIKRADAAVRLVYARLYRLALRTFFGLRVRDVDCACKLFRRDALRPVRLESGGAFLSAELLIKIKASGGRVAEVGVPHYPRVAGSASGANPRVVLRAVRDFWRLRLRLWANRKAALRRGEPVIDVGPRAS